MLQELPTLSPAQYTLVYNVFSFTVATMAAAFVFFVMSQKTLAAKYQITMIVSALVAFVAAYHYWHLVSRWEHAYALNQSIGMYEPTGDLFTDAYRYADWILTVPLLLVEYVLVLDLAEGETGPVAWKLGFAGVLMVLLGYPGVATGRVELFGWRGLWGLFSTLPFVYILYTLFVGLQNAIEEHSEKVTTLLQNARLLLLASWAYYPVAYILPMIHGTQYPTKTPVTVVGLQIGYAIADLVAKAGFGVLVYHIARQQSIEDGFRVDDHAPSTAS